MEDKNKVKIGKVTGNKMDKTVVVAVESLRKHILYKKVIRYTVRYKAHDDKNMCHVGDVVKIIETRPLSKTKRWRVSEVISTKKSGKVDKIAQ